MFTQRLTNTAISLMNGKPTSRDLMLKIPANNPPNFLKILRHDFGITILKKRVKNKSHYIFWIPKYEHLKVRKLIASAGTLATDKLNILSKNINSKTILTQPNSMEKL